MFPNNMRWHVVPLDLLVPVACCFSPCPPPFSGFQLRGNSSLSGEVRVMVPNQAIKLMFIAEIKGLTLLWGMWGHVLASFHVLSLTMPQRWNQGYYGHNLFLFLGCHHMCQFGILCFPTLRSKVHIWHRQMEGRLWNVPAAICFQFHRIWFSSWARDYLRPSLFTKRYGDHHPEELAPSGAPSKQVLWLIHCNHVIC